MRVAVFATVFLALVALSTAQWGLPRQLDKVGGSAVFLGDETTADGGYIRYLKDLIGKTSSAYAVSTVAVRGATVNQFLKSNEFKNFQNTNPDYVFVFLGKNDGKKSNFNRNNLKKDLDAIFRKINALNTKPIVFAITPSAVYDNKLGLDATTVNIRVAEVVQDVARANRAILIDDVSVSTAAHQEWFPDGVHPNDNGSKAIAQSIYDTIKKYFPNAFTAPVVPSPTKKFQPEPNVAYRISSKQNKGFVLAAQRSGSLTRNRDIFVVLDNWANTPEQKWYFTDSVADAWTIQTSNGRNINADSQGKPLKAGEISHNNKQDWTFVPDEKNTGAYYIINVATKQALDNTGCKVNKLNPLQLWPSNKNDCQTWFVEEAK